MRRSHTYRRVYSLIWDNLNTEEKIFDILADGISVEIFDPSVTSYTVQVERGTAVLKNQRQRNGDGKCRKSYRHSRLTAVQLLRACGKTYTISFEQITPDMTLSFSHGGRRHG